MKEQVAVIFIGNELLSGRVVNTNMSFLGLELAKIGLPLLHTVVIRDEEDAIQTALQDYLNRFKIIFTIGGLGPTSDDVTKKSVASYFSKELIFDDSIWSKVTARFALRGLETPEVNRGQAEVPEGFTFLENKLGTAPGLSYQHKEQILFMLPGVPAEMKNLFLEKVKPLLVEAFPNPPQVVRTIHTIDIPESSLVELIEDVSIPESLELAYLPQPGRVDLRLTGSDEKLIDPVLSSLRARCSRYIWGYDEETLPGIIHNLMIENKLSLTVAESCTGGLVAALLTDIPGASGFFLGGVVAYGDGSKRDLLGVSKSCLQECGAVSIETALEMAEGVREKFQSDLGASITGIAGPDGGSEEKPVGTVCFAVSYKNKIKGVKRVFPGTRQSIRENAAHFLLNLIRQILLGEYKVKPEA